jgi:hypothetical protein
MARSVPLLEASLKVWVFEDNLIWSERLLRTLRSLGHEATALVAIPDGGEKADTALINLSSRAVRPETLAPSLKSMGVRTIGFAGHKEKEVLAAGRAIGCDVVATNSEVTFKLESLLGPV